MTIKLAKDLICHNFPIDELKGKVVAIDISPWLYKYLFTYNKNNSSLTNSKGVLTGHLLGFLYFLKNLKRYEITPVICFDGETPDIKKEEVEKRASQKAKTFHKFDLLEKHGLVLTKDQQEAKLNSTLYIGIEEKKTIITACEYLGFTYYKSPFVEGENACCKLKKSGIVDECLTTDRDAILYEVSFYSHIDFKNKSLTHYDYSENLSKLGLKTHSRLVKAAICSGCDYTKGLFGIGPKMILSLLDKPQKLNPLIEKEIPNFEQIEQMIYANIPMSGLCVGKKNPYEFAKFLKELEFSEPNILHFCNYLF